MNIRVTKLFNQFKAKISTAVDKFTLLNLFTLLGIFSVLTTAVWFLNRTPKEVQAGWFNDNWLYRKSIPVTNNTSEETDVYISVTIDTSDTSKFQGDCGDLRFTKQNGQQLEYYISSGCGTASTIIHVNFHIFPAGNQTLYYYYGNPSTANGFTDSDFSTEASDYTIGTIGSEEQSPGPVAYWKFDEGYGDTAYDSSQNGNDGTIYNATWKPESECLSGKCLYLDGNEDYVQIPDSDSLDVDRNGTWEAWVKSDLNMSNRGSLIFKHYNNEYEILVSDTGIIQVYHGDGTWEEINEPSAKTVTANEWTHIAVVRDHDTQTYTWYINGVNSGTDTYTDTPLASGNDVYIGTRGGGTNYKGYVDEIKIYPYARSAQEIQADFLSRGSVHGTSADMGANSIDYLNKGLIGHWKMEETSSPAVDSSGIGTTGAWQDTTSSVAGRFGNGIDFDGTGDFIALADNAVTMAEDTPWTLAAWINADAFGSGNYPGIFGNNLSSGQYQRIQFANNSSELCIEDKNNTDSGCGNKWTHDMSTDTWHHLVVVNNGADSDNLELFVDSSSKGKLSMALTEWEIRQIGGRGGSDHKLNGTLDEVRVYNRALSPKEVRDLYNWAPESIVYYNFDEGSGTSLYDRSGNGNDSDSFGGNPTWANGKYGNSLDFDDNDYARNNSFSIGSDPNFTVTGWFKKTANMNGSGAWGMGAGGTSQETISGWCNNGENIGIDLWGTSTYYVNEEYPLNDWVHIAWVKFDSNFTTNTLKIYVNGVERDLNVSRDGSDTVNLSSGLTVGGIYASSSYNAPVTVDDFKVYNYARSQKQIVEDMNAGHPIGGSPVGSQIAYWKFDEGYGDTVHDSSPNSNTGTFGNDTSWYNEGKLGKAVYFDGNGDYIDITEDAINHDYTEMSLSAWIKPTLADHGRIFKHSSGNAFYYKVNDSSNTLCAYLNIEGVNSNWQCSSESINLNEWSHVAFSWNGTSGTLNHYINGSFAGTNSTDTGSADYSSNEFRIGWDGTYDFHGYIDELKIYNSALTEDEIKLDHNQGKSTVMGALSTESDGTTGSNSASRAYCIPGDTTACTPPIAEWKFDEKQGSDANDTSGNGNTGSLENMESSDWKSSINCHSGSCLEFDGVNEYVNMPNVNPTSAITVSGWAKAPSGDYSGVWQLISKYSAYIIGDNNNVTGQVCFLIYDDTWYPSGYGSGTGCYTVTDPEKWHYFVGTYDGSDMRFYVDGVLRAENSHTGSINPDGGNLHIAHRETSSVGSYHFAGLIDDIKIYDYARTPAQIAWDFNRGKPVGWWKLDECEGTTAYDSSGNSNDGTITIGGSGDQDTTGSCGIGNTAAAWSNGADGKINASLNFDGSDDYITVTDSDDFDPKGNNFSMSTWFKVAQHRDYNRIITKGTNPGFFCFHRSSGETQCSWYGSTNDSASNTIISSTPLSAWNHLVITKTDSTIKGYYNGVETFSENIAIGSVENSNDLEIGKLSSSYMEGQADDVRIYNYALTGHQVKNLYNAGSAIRFAE